MATSPEPSLRNGKEAVRLAERASGLCRGQDPHILDTLAAAYAEAGLFPDAVQTANKALELAAGHNKAALVDSLQTLIKLYQAGSPYRKP